MHYTQTDMSFTSLNAVFKFCTCRHVVTLVHVMKSLTWTVQVLKAW